MLINKEVGFFYNLGVGCVWGVIAPVLSVSQWGTLLCSFLGSLPKPVQILPTHSSSGRG